MEGLLKDVLGLIFEKLELHDLLMLRLSCRRLNSVLVEGELLRHRVLNVFGAHSIWESMSECLSSSPNSVPVLEVPPVFRSIEVLDMVFGAISSIGVADRKGPKFTNLSEMISYTNPRSSPVLLAFERTPQHPESSNQHADMCSANLKSFFRVTTLPTEKLVVDSQGGLFEPLKQRFI
jgi:hypothetical protein